VVATDIDAEAAAATRNLVMAEGGRASALRLDVTLSEDFATARDHYLETWVASIG
jgi:hypothetical protein